LNVLVDRSWNLPIDSSIENADFFFCNYYYSCFALNIRRKKITFNQYVNQSNCDRENGERIEKRNSIESNIQWQVLVIQMLTKCLCLWSSNDLSILTDAHVCILFKSNMDRYLLIIKKEKEKKNIKRIFWQVLKKLYWKISMNVWFVFLINQMFVEIV
jgi:hypothetical protein